MARNRAIQLIISAKDQTKRVLRRISARIKQFGVGVTRIFTGVTAGIAAVTATLGVLFARMSGQIDQQAKVAAKLGVTNEQLSILRDAADDAGISSNTLDMALQRMTRRVSEAAQGSGEAVDALKELGLNAEDLNKKTPDQAMRDIVTALEGVENQADRVRLAFKLFDSEGVGLVNLTSKALQQAQGDAEGFGLKISEAQTKAVESANDSWGRITRVVRDFFQYITATIAPGIDKALSSAFLWLKEAPLKSWATSAGESVRSVATMLVNAIPNALLVVLTGINLVTKAFTGWKLLWAELKYYFSGFMEFFWGQLNRAREATISLLESVNVNGVFDEQIANGKRIAEEQRQIISKTREEQRKALEEEKQVISAQQKKEAELDSYASKIGEISSKISSIVQAETEAGKAAESAEKNKVAAYDSTTQAIEKQIRAVLKLKAAQGGASTGSFQVTKFAPVDDLADTLENEADR